MASAAPWQKLTASEMEFMAEQELIDIIPHFGIRDNGGVLNFISGDFGPFQPGITARVPLWLAVMLKQLNKCRIIEPSWFSVAYLTNRLEREKESDIFEELPFHYLEIASLLFKHAAEDIEQVEHIRSLLEDIQNVRQDKIRNGLYKIANDVQSGGTAYAIQMNNISALEINSVRQFMVGSLNKFYRLAKLNEDGAENDFTQSQSQFYTDTQSSADSAPVSRLRRFR
ncbi:hypothetical protein Poli38472_008381 [Pythium oligandrum]|uniref:DNA replication complex GINS protein PSF2 n=1 Tax=Pythium oligandrum TaxID=41045 RepID=A0A8K1CLJ0_PYTOL|nr:hypothetical protein Poli38472_008381 [Pythium oligandrum]|eukprot:TMW65739.1 hypothetical protein Poli38472_008381 [Pythium oligandrum]